MKPITSIEDLRWYYQDSEAALGKRAQALNPTSYISSANRDFAPTDAVCRDANRQRRIAEEIARLSGQHQAALEFAYEVRNLDEFRRRSIDIRCEAGLAEKRFARKGKAQTLSTKEENAIVSIVRSFEEPSQVEGKNRLRVSVPIVERVFYEYATRIARLMDAVLLREKDAEQALADGDESEVEWSASELSARRTELRETREAAESAEREGVQLLRDAHAAYLVARRLLRAQRRGDAKERKERLRERTVARRAVMPEGERLANRHDRELDRLVGSMREVLTDDDAVREHLAELIASVCDEESGDA